jgi:RNA polymerase sigma factor (sigma-70 family)
MTYRIVATGHGDAGAAMAAPMSLERGARPSVRVTSSCSHQAAADQTSPLRCSGDAGQTELVAAVAAGERGALTSLYEEHGEAVFSYLMTLCVDRGLAEEALQDTFVAVWRGAALFQGRSRVRTWLLAIARRQAWAKLRRRGEEPIDPSEFLGAPAPDPTPEEHALASAALERLAAAIGRLPPLQREIVVLAFVHQLSYAEMAETLEVPLGTVRSRLAGARHQLSTILSERENDA